MRVQRITVSCFRSFGEQQNMLQVKPGVTTIVQAIKSYTNREAEEGVSSC